MKQDIVKLGSVILCVLLFSPLCFAYSTGAATRYEVKMRKVEVYSSTGGWVTVYDDSTGSLALDIASAQSSSSAGVFAAGLTIPDGVYTKCRVTPATTFRISGTFAGYHTTATTHPDDDPGGVSRTASVAQPTGTGTETACDVVILDKDLATLAIQENTFNTPVTVTKGNPDHNIRVNFDVSTTLGLHAHVDAPYGYIILPEPPVVTVTAVDD